MGEVRVQQFGPSEKWRAKDDLVVAERDSQTYWDALDDERRQAVLLIVREALSQLMVDPNAWVPTSLEAINGHRLDVYIGIHLAEVDDEVVAQKLRIERDLHQATVGVRQIEADLRVTPDGDGV